MKKLKLITQVVLSTLFMKAQTPWYSNYNFSAKILDQLAQDSMTQRAAQELSFIGEYETTLSIWDRNQPKTPAHLSPEQANDFSRFKARDAKAVILEKAKTEQIILINEAHQQAYHRVFTTSLLHGLYQAGFRYFGAETISNQDSCVNELRKNKYPTFKSGYYTADPFYGHLIREAIKEGFEVFAYETTRLDKDDSAGINLREVEQAKNIKKILDKDPKAKILIHCGWDHIVETELPGWGKAMAGRLYEYTGINPFTIDQTKLTEHSSKDYDNPYWTSINLDFYALFVDSSGQIFSGPRDYKPYDARVYHPKTKWQHGRPHWVFENNRTPYVLKQKLDVSFPCLVFAFISKEKKENDQAIPFDIIELKSANDQKALSLLKDQHFTIVVRDQNLREQRFEVSLD